MNRKTLPRLELGAPKVQYEAGESRLLGQRAINDAISFWTSTLGRELLRRKGGSEESEVDGRKLLWGG
jgi:hypothetical protein